MDGFNSPRWHVGHRAFEPPMECNIWAITKHNRPAPSPPAAKNALRLRHLLSTLLAAHLHSSQMSYAVICSTRIQKTNPPTHLSHSRRRGAKVHPPCSVRVLKDRNMAPGNMAPASRIRLVTLKLASFWFSPVVCSLHKKT